MILLFVVLVLGVLVFVGLFLFFRGFRLGIGGFLGLFGVLFSRGSPVVDAGVFGAYPVDVFVVLYLWVLGVY